jgi:hypothetical protein
MFESQRSDAKLKNELASGKLGYRVQSHSLVHRNSNRNSEIRRRNHTITSTSLTKDIINEKRNDHMNR